MSTSSAAPDPRKAAEDAHEEALRSLHAAGDKAEDNIAAANRVLGSGKPTSRKFRLPHAQRKK